MKPDAFMPLYGGDLLEAISGYSDSVGMAYIRATWHYWRHTHCEGLPDDDTYLSRLCRPDEPWEAVKPIVFGQLFRLESGKWHQHRARKEYGKACRNYEKRCAQTSAARAKLSVSKPVTDPVTETVTPLQSESESESVGEKEKGASEVARGCPEIPPMSRKDFDTLCEMRGVPKDCADHFWNKFDAVGWLHQGQPIRKVEPMLMNALANWRARPTVTATKHEVSDRIAASEKLKILRRKEAELKDETSEMWQRNKNPEKVKKLESIQSQIAELEGKVLAS